MDNTQIDFITCWVVLGMLTLVFYAIQLMVVWNRDKSIKSKMDYILLLLPGGCYIIFLIGAVMMLKNQFSFFKGLPWI